MDWLQPKATMSHSACWHIILLALASVTNGALIGCSHGPCVQPMHATWLTPVPRLFYESKIEHILPVEQMYFVLDEMQPTACHMLSRKNIIRLSPEQAASLLQITISHASGGDLYLVRAVRSKSTSGQFECRMYKKRLLVAFHGLAQSDRDAENVALILRLSERPKCVYIGNYLMQ